MAIQLRISKNLFLLTNYKRKRGEEKMKSDMQKEIGERLRRIRSNLGLTQKQFAGRLCPPSDYTDLGKVERGEQLPSLYFLTRVTKAFSVPIRYFFDERIADLWDYYSRVKDLVKKQESLSHQVTEKLDQIFKAVTNLENWLAKRIAMVEKHKVDGKWKNEYWRGCAEILYEIKKRENL